MFVIGVLDRKKLWKREIKCSIRSLGNIFNATSIALDVFLFFIGDLYVCILNNDLCISKRQIEGSKTHTICFELLLLLATDQHPQSGLAIYLIDTEDLECKVQLPFWVRFECKY